MQYHVQDALIYLNALTVTDEDDKMSHEPLQRQLYNSYGPPIWLAKRADVL